MITKKDSIRFARLLEYNYLMLVNIQGTLAVDFLLSVLGIVLFFVNRVAFD